ncbi:helix-turn-helix transcriptional regulator [Anaerocolumna aminovalerica]|uniref:Helix-turn-helix n=1 Tax=Anaerocolumna aminovalerica TaxID=1527 RepID=A0A1I5EN74_9FIRM|nr:helix-turn-helix transcriptional regulator [Anaerocolumna aminovalerica]MBU5331895.1 helix-turn-helix domain-containing protein [Anaerocolumna aminovalerica]MDU6264179.1 helix-turn-helix transcriptional regulator [Anaerocolumna aminovalerica]SFO12909.1 Helix-turn-helix [Anaerocolumna aminovalerica]
MEFKDKIKNRRLELNMTMDELAKIVGVSTPTIQRYESGEIKNVRRDKIKLLADALQCSPSYLMGWDEKPWEQPQLSKSEEAHLYKYRSIDNKGKHTVDTVLEMEYNRCNKPHLVVNAAHAIEGATEEELQHDNDIMNDDNF